MIYITFYYPPYNAVASLQNWYIVSHLRNLGWEIDVVTIREEDIAREGNFDRSMMKDMDHERIHHAPFISYRNAAIHLNSRFRGIFGRCSSPDVRQESRNDRDTDRNVAAKVKNFITDELLAFPDRYSDWIRGGYSLAREIIRTRGSRLIYASGPPYSSLIIGRLLKNKYRIPLALDFRDPWIGNPYVEKRSRLFMWGSHWLENWVVMGADYIRANTDHIARIIYEQVPHFPGKLKVGGGGFTEYIRLPEIETTGPRKPFTIIHAGALYVQRNPKNFLIAVKMLIQEKEVSVADIRIRLMGDVGITDPGFWALMNDPDLSSCIEIGSLSHADCIEAMLRSDLLIAFQQGTSVQIPAKLYEYLSLGKPILCIADAGGATWEFVHREGFGTCVPDDVGEIFLILKKKYKEWSGESRQVFYTNSYKYHYKNISARLDLDLISLLPEGM